MNREEMAYREGYIAGLNERTRRDASPLRKRRREVGFTVSALAKRVGIARSYLSEMESGKKRSPSARIVKELADALDVSMETVVEWLDEETDECQNSR